MPQMAPISWLTLLLYFIAVFILFNILNYFTFSYKIKESSTSKSTIKYNWKW